MAKSPALHTYFTRLLREAGYKATAGRLRLLAVLRASKEPLSIQELMRKLAGTKIDQATVYRVLSVLEGIGVVRQVNLRHGHADYEFVDADDHHHLVCMVCKRVEDLPGCDSEAIAAQTLKKAKHFAKITQHSFEFFGICNTCAK
jgi:Fe2+ or Zn2+ uptake regulation protein